MTSKLIVNNIEADAGVSTITFGSEISASTFTGNLTGNVTGNVTSSSTSTFSSGLNVTGGSVGIGTDAPAEDVHIQKSRADVLIEGTNDTVSGNVANLSLMAPFYRKVGYSIKDSDGNEDFFIGRPYAQGDANPDLIINMTGTEKVRIRNSGNIGIGTDNPKAQTWRNGTALDVHGGSGSVVGNLHIGANRGDGVQTVGSLVFYDNTQDTNHKVISIIESDKTGSTSNQRGGTVTVYVKEDATVSNSAVQSATFTKDGISFPSGKGIDFSATADGGGTTTSELLDDYEKGAWTPTLLGTSTDPTVTYSNRPAEYIKIGNQVTVWLFIQVNTASGGSGNLNIGGLPFNVNNDSGKSEGGTFTVNWYGNTGFSAGEIPSGFSRRNDDKIYMTKLGVGSGSGVIAVTSLGSGWALYGCMTYYVN